MALFVMEREFEQAIDAGELRALAARSTNGEVTHRRSYLAPTGRRALSVFEAASEDAVQRAAQHGAGRCARLWSAWSYVMPDRTLELNEALVMVERSFPEPADLPDLERRERGAAWCLEQYNVRFLWHYMAEDGLRSACCYGAPDAEAVRITQRTAQMPVDSIWAARVVDIE